MIYSMKQQRYTGPIMKEEHHHIYIEPAKKIQDVVAHYTITFASIEPVECFEYHILPDASGCIIYQGEHCLDYWGPMTELVVLENDLREAEDRFFIEFHPGGLYRLSGNSLYPYQNHREELKQFHEALAQQFQSLYRMSDTYDELVEHCNTFIAHEIQKHPIPERILSAQAMIDNSNGIISMAEVAVNCAVSQRQLRRDFAKYIGVSPKEYAGIVRINYLAKEVQKDELMTTALQGGFFDQAHFNKMFKQILHVSPSTYIENIQDFYREIYKF